jgi:hypothetical protein
MIVYGDAVRDLPRDRAMEHARAEIDVALEGAPSTERIRRALIHLGEIEQALYDAEGTPQTHGDDLPCAAARTATDAAADAFERVSSLTGPGDERTLRRVREDLRRSRRALALVPPSGDAIRIRVAEGYAFYGLLPEHYRSSALRWALERRDLPRRDVLVAGIRTIGTSLSAVVAATLRGLGFRVRRLTVRPGGHPFDRRAEGTVPRASHGIVVDEGPGLSGSSMLAVADLLRRSGIDRVDLFPAHGSGPGAAATAASRRRWRALGSYVAGPDAIEAGPGDLAASLWSGIEELRGDGPVLCEDWGGGAWRARLYDEPSRWPASPRALERPKLLLTGRSGRRVLFKFSGLATSARGRGSMAGAVARRLDSLARAGWVPAPLGIARGYLALEWVPGSPCSPEDASSETLTRVAVYLAASARGPLPPRDAKGAWRRLVDMTRVNTEEALGRDAARAALDIVESSGVALEGTPAAGDGRMAPHEWIRTPEGRLVKTDAGGHEIDHTWVGRQPLHWDLAGTLLEWDLHGDAAAAFLVAFEAATGIQVQDHLHGYRLAYAAHRMGQSRLFAETEPDPLERGIQERAFGRWRDTLLRILSDREERRGMVA